MRTKFCPGRPIWLRTTVSKTVNLGSSPSWGAKYCSAPVPGLSSKQDHRNWNDASSTLAGSAKIYWDVAQVAERLTLNQQVLSSILSVPANVQGGIIQRVRMASL